MPKLVRYHFCIQLLDPEPDLQPSKGYVHLMGCRHGNATHFNYYLPFISVFEIPHFKFVLWKAITSMI